MHAPQRSTDAHVRPQPYLGQRPGGRDRLVTRDPILPWRIDGRRARAALTDAEIVIFNSAGHQPFIEQPEEFLDRTASFLSRLRTANTV